MQAHSPFAKILGPDAFGIQNFFRYGIQSTYDTKLPVGGGDLSQHLIIQSIHISAVKCMNFHNKSRKRPQTQFGASLAIKEFVCRVCKRTFSFLGILDFEMEGKRV